jgi:multiple antibiotic resistance protein
MDDYFAHAATVFMGFFAIMNPIANTPVYLSLTAEDERAVGRSVAYRAVGLAFVLVLVFSLSGKLIFDMFGITLPAFRITGGALVFLIGFHMLQGELSRVQNPTTADNQKSREAELSVAITPLGIPILAGPGTIATAMNFAAEGGWVGLATTIGAFLLLCLITLWFFLFGERLVSFVGESAIKVLTRMMGLILAVVGTQMLIAGIAGAIDLYR